MRRWTIFVAALAAGIAAAAIAPAAAPVDKGIPKPKIDPAVAAHQIGEPSLQDILDKLGYDIDTKTEEIPAQLFRKAGRGPVTHEPIAAFGLPKVCASGWYIPTEARPTLKPTWQTDEKHNKQYTPPIAAGGKITFNPGRRVFGLFVSTAGFKDETVCTQDALQKYVPRFPADDRHKAHVFPARRNGQLIPNTYVIGWEYSTNDDDQDMVTLVSNVTPVQ
ncbi:MAG TPA: hypothetical protein VFJ58_08875 [Armatimonadota bacterium]|nr:hypothetical protein [Armatimonadota bacterium]